MAPKTRRPDRRTGRGHSPSAPEDTSKPSAVFKPAGPRTWTLSVAVPGSIMSKSVAATSSSSPSRAIHVQRLGLFGQPILYLAMAGATADLHGESSAQTHELRTTLAGQIGRALAVFCVDEVIVYDDVPSSRDPVPKRARPGEHGTEGGWNGDENDSQYTGVHRPARFLARLLSFLETPPYLRQRLFPIHPDLRSTGLLPSLAMPHHLKADEHGPYREGIVVADQPSHAGAGVNRRSGVDTNANATATTTTALVDIGLPDPVSIPTALPIPTNTRITICLDQQNGHPAGAGKKEARARATAAHPDTPRKTDGYYWGYRVREAAGLSNVFAQSPFTHGYDLTIGTSERGDDVADVIDRLKSASSSSRTRSSSHDELRNEHGQERDQESGQGHAPNTKSPALFKHMLVVFGGVAGLEAALDAPYKIKSMQNGNKADINTHGKRPHSRSVVEHVRDLFDHWVNVCPGQGSRTIRTEEALWIALSCLRPVLTANDRA